MEHFEPAFSRLVAVQLRFPELSMPEKLHIDTGKENS
jgi:hypothetical protein